MKIALLIVIMITTLFGGKLLEPTAIYKVSKGLVTDLLYEKPLLYVATDAGVVDIFNTNNRELVQTIKLSMIKDFMGDDVESKIFALDMLEKELLILSQDSGGYSRVALYDGEKLHYMITNKERLNIIEAKFVDKDHLLLALISNDIILYNIKSKEKEWSKQASMSKFSSFALNNDRSSVAIADESGDVHILATASGKLIKKLYGQNVDNIFSIDYRGQWVVTGGQDRRAAVYNVAAGTGYYKTSDFFVYGVGLSPSGEKAAYSSDMNNNITLFFTKTGEVIGHYASDSMIVNSIYFINEQEFFINSSSNSVRYFKIK